MLSFLLSSKRGLKNKKEDPLWLFLTIRLKKDIRISSLAAIASHIPVDIMKTEIILEPEESTGLLKRSLLRLDFIMTTPEELISRKIGALAEYLMNEVEHKLKIVFGIKK